MSNLSSVKRNRGLALHIFLYLAVLVALAVSNTTMLMFMAAMALGMFALLLVHTGKQFAPGAGMPRAASPSGRVIQRVASVGAGGAAYRAFTAEEGAEETHPAHFDVLSSSAMVDDASSYFDAEDAFNNNGVAMCGKFDMNNDPGGFGTSH